MSALSQQGSTLNQWGSWVVRVRRLAGSRRAPTLSGTAGCACASSGPVGGSKLAPSILAPWAALAVGGWEANARGKTGPRMADLGPSMDPQQLAASGDTQGPGWEWG